MTLKKRYIKPDFDAINKLLDDPGNADDLTFMKKFLKYIKKLLSNYDDPEIYDSEIDVRTTTSLILYASSEANKKLEEYQKKKENRR